MKRSSQHFPFDSATVLHTSIAKRTSSARSTSSMKLSKLFQKKKFTFNSNSRTFPNIQTVYLLFNADLINFPQVLFFLFLIPLIVYFFNLQYFSIQSFIFEFLEGIKKTRKDGYDGASYRPCKGLHERRNEVKTFSPRFFPNLILDSSADRPSQTKKNSKRLPSPPVRVFRNLTCLTFCV